MAFLFHLCTGNSHSSGGPSVCPSVHERDISGPFEGISLNLALTFNWTQTEKQLDVGGGSSKAEATVTSCPSHFWKYNV